MDLQTSLRYTQLGLNIKQQLNLLLNSGAALKKWKKLANKSKDRYNRLKELVMTERDYYTDLVTIREKIKKQLLAAHLISSVEGNSMFPNIDGMIDLSDQICQEFKDILDGWSRKNTMIGAAMIKFSRFLMIYSDFFKNLTQTQQKLRTLLTKQEKARQIQKSLSTPNRIVTFQDLISKPFQRPLKYHLILRDYWSKTPEDHPDYLPLKAAIDCFHKVNQQNNLSIQNKQKSQTMVTLHHKFGNIIQSQARYYITQYDAVCLQTPVVIYLFSDLAILVHKKLADKQFMRIIFDKYSHVELAGDVSLFKNRLYFYGKKNCIHLTFIGKAQRDEVHHTIKQLIEEINQKQLIREITIIQRLSSRKSLERRFSYTNLEPQLVRPVNAEILGMETRCLGPQNIRFFYVIQFYPTPANLKNIYTPHHVSLLQEDTILHLQKMINLLYPNQLKCLPISTVPKGIVNQHQYRKSYSYRVQLRGIFTQLFLNSLFRNDQIIKRIDYILHTLKISDPIWHYLKINNQRCQCPACTMSPQIKNHDDFFRQVSNRAYQKMHMNNKYRKAEFCQMRTINAHQKFSQLFPQMLYKARTEQKIAWVKCKLGRINHSLANTYPDSPQTQPIKLKITMRGFPNKYEFDIKGTLHDRAHKIISMVGHKRQVNLEDYVLVADINGRAVILDDDQPLSNLQKKKEPQGLFESLSSIFAKKQDYPIKLFLEKYWVIFSSKDYINMADKSRRIKLNFQVEAVMSRLHSGEIRVGDEDMLEFYALFLCKRYYSEYKQFTAEKVAMKIRNKAEIFFPSRLHEESAISRLYRKIEKYKDDALIKSDFDFGLRILQKASTRPGWSCLMEEVLLQTGNSKPVTVNVGCDLKGVKVREKDKFAMSLQFKFEQDTWTCHTKGQTLIITDGDGVFNFSGRQVWKIRKQIEFYQLYNKSFGLH